MNIRAILRELRALAGLERSTTSHTEKMVSALGAFLGILAVYWSSALMLSDITSKTLIITSMGASAVLLFAVPHGALSQPWPLLGGNLLSAFTGVSVSLIIQDPFLASATAVGLAVAVMHYFRCIHPPGGATALTAVIGGEQIQALGFQYLVTPVLVNLLAIILIAMLFNSLFHWRRYPAHLARRHSVTEENALSVQEYELTQEDFAAAMEQFDSYIDVTSEGLTELLQLAKEHAQQNTTHPSEILPGRCYSNGKIGSLWSVRQIIDESDRSRGGRAPVKDSVIYKIVAGAGAWETGICARDQFRQWARFEVVLQNNRWIKVSGSPSDISQKATRADRPLPLSSGQEC